MPKKVVWQRSNIKSHSKYALLLHKCHLSNMTACSFQKFTLKSTGLITAATSVAWPPNRRNRLVLKQVVYTSVVYYLHLRFPLHCDLVHFLHLPSNTCYNNDYKNDYNKITSKGYNCHPGYSRLCYDNGRLDLANEICECKNILSGTHSNGQQWWRIWKMHRCNTILSL